MSFDQIVREALEQTAERIRSGNVMVSVAQDMPKVRVDMPRIVVVLVNLIENSREVHGGSGVPRDRYWLQKERGDWRRVEHSQAYHRGPRREDMD